MQSRVLKIANEIPESEVSRIMEIIKETFGQEWLMNPNPTNPLQILWQRPDVQATTELYNFGVSLEVVLAIDTQWTKSQLDLVKSNHANNQRGAIFEIFALGAMHVDEQRVELARDSNPGYDAIIHLTAQKRLRLSLKSYGMSASEIEFRRYAFEFEVKFVEEIKKRKIHSIQLFIDAYSSTPSPERWKDLISRVSEIVDKYDYSKLNKWEIDDFWSLMILKINDEKQYHKNYSSYFLLITSELHKNEYLNVYNKLDDACDNLAKHHGHEDQSIANVIFVHMPPTVSIERCIFYVENYLSERPTKEISAVMLYQPSVVSDKTYSYKHINHCFLVTQSQNKLQNFLPEGPKILLQIPIGKITEIPASVQMVSINGGKTFPADQKYLFQRGHFYIETKTEEGGSLTGTVKKIAPGVFEECVITVPDQGSISFAPRQPLDDALLII